MNWDDRVVSRTLQHVAGAEILFARHLLRHLEPLGGEAIKAISQAVRDVGAAHLAEAAALEAEGQLRRIVRSARGQE